MRAVVKRWGNSASVRIPSAILGESGLRLDQPVNIRTENGRVIIEPLQENDIDVLSLIALITPENAHNEVDFGAPQGKELL
ncbi:MAG: AbrB/MazE/SpoVT family DNA-binding domain-containing protein [Rhodobacteraceae bacterium]|jgi:antitoxin MazE|nr:AbrB/MazE/SpoVT family DNA-binding domain-containing protein [Paracoccaceae bacterium]